MMKRVSEAEEAGLNLTSSDIPKTHFRMAFLICMSTLTFQFQRVVSFFQKILTLQQPRNLRDLKLLDRLIIRIIVK